MRPSRRPVRTFEEILHLLPSTQLTMLGSFYPSEKLRVIDQLHLVAQRNAPFALSSIPIREAQWHFRTPHLYAQLEIGHIPVPIRLIGVVEQVNLSSRLMGPYLTIHPYYANDLERAKELFAPSKEFDPEFDEDCQVHAITLSFLRAQPPYPNYDHLNGTGHPPPPHLAVDVFDDTTWTGTFDSPRLPPDFLNPNDLIVTTCHLNLRANPDHGEAAFYLVVTEIRIVHVARDFLPA
ncbi:hypothetical protein PYCCODRAFT_1470395 [Trametes coccinea BRFM310]|uniref:Uncharacterized protein n=2 Tax=Trametes TaxID=5324 RepID=A0A1Y2ID60_TRAC3|nr:hypothetical protein NUW54_g236 [Trametes sanguinea]OSC97820.1 hypothetical protein PYCCODRAFT_1471590 [Trametes coccinea BRFM310]OSC99119.1 hypothetical protein PYCCODRAFT_1470395 [Trametes coccinea BRFM310]